MNRKDAVAYLKELLIQCKEMSPEAVTFQAQNQNTTDYRVLIKGSMNSTDKAAVKEIARKYSYQIKEDFDSIEIYNFRS
ncbi:MAG: hypothetical protein NWE93_05475 [Candidatus Bathyarchaeota archaeon]|nr:hypothetical protein [Candidatus Bathyarchaeota archaeon]